MSVVSQPVTPLTAPRWAPIAAVCAVVAASMLITLYGFAQQQLFFVLAGLVSVPVGLAMLRWPHAATLGAVAILYTNAADIAVTFYRVPYVLGASFLLLLVIPLIKYLVIDRKPLVAHPILPLIAALLAVELLGVIFARQRSEAMHFFTLFVVEGVIVYLLVSNVVRTPQMLRAVTWVLLGCGAFMGSLSCIQQATGTYHNNYGGFAQIESEGFGVVSGQQESRQFRLGGPLGKKNRYAQIMLMLVPLGVFLMFSERRPWLRRAAAVGTLLTVAGMTLAFSRGAAVGAAAMLLVMASLRYISLRQAALVIAGGVMMLVIFPQYLTRLESLASLGAFTSKEVEVGAVMPDGALNSRTTAMLCAAQAFIDHPLIGVGPGMFPLHYQDYARWVGRDYEAMHRDAHNLYLGIAAEHGLLGLFCFLMIFFVILRDLHYAHRKWIHRRPELAHLTAAYLLAIVSYLATGIGLHLAYFRFFWFMLAMAGAAAYIARTARDSDFETTSDHGREWAAKDAGTANQHQLAQMAHGRHWVGRTS